MPAPTFLCIGVQKGGTSWLSRAVLQHPQVGTGVKKELQFFNHAEAYARGLDWYESQLRAKARTKAVGEFTPNYWWTVGTTTGNHLLGSHDRVADAYPDLRLLLCLRHPVDRAVSAYFHHMRARRYPPSTSLLEAVERYPDIREFGLYGTQLDAWLTRYPLESFRVLVYEEDIKPDAAKRPTLRRVFSHLGVNPGFVPDDLTAGRNERATDFDLRLRNATGVRAVVMKRLPERVRESSRWEIAVADADRRALAEVYRPEVARLEELLGRSMPWDLG